LVSTSDDDDDDDERLGDSAKQKLFLLFNKKL